MTKQATRANRAQVEQHIERQKRGLGSEFAQDHPVIDAIVGSFMLAFAVGGMVALWVSVGAGV